MRLEEQERRRAIREGRPIPGQSADQGSQEGYWSYMQRQVQERTEKLGVAGDQMDRLEESSSNFAKDVNKYVQNQKKKAVLGGEYSRFAWFWSCAAADGEQRWGRNLASRLVGCIVYGLRGQV